MSGYITIQDASAPGRQTVSELLIAGCACACIVVGALLMGNSNALYSASKVQPPTTIFSTPAPTMRSLDTPARAPLNAQPEPSRTSIFTVPSASPMRAVIGGFVFAAFASLSAFILNRMGNQKVHSKFLEAEANWSMAAATAFIGTKAPDFKATAVFDQEFTDIQLSQYKGKKYVVLFFYPLDFTFVCPTEITAFSDRAAEFEAIGTQILGVSVDSQFSHLAWIQTPRSEGGLGELKYPLVADLKKEIAESYGVLTEDGIALRGLFIIDKEGVIQHATINNLAFGRNVDETLRTLEALQYVQANPDEVCPAGWKKGDKTMKPDPTGSKEYFKAL